MAVVVTARSGYDLGYVWKGQRERQAEGGAERASSGGYYIDAAQQGEAPGRWFGRGAEALGFQPGQVVEREPYEKVYRQTDPRTGERLGRSAPGYAKFREHLGRLAAAEPYATSERLLELERQAAQETRKAPAYVDVTASFSKSISILDASFMENARRARLAGDEAAAWAWDARHAEVAEAIQAANRAGLEHLQRWAVTRTGSHGRRINGQEPGRYEPTGLVITSWLQGTSRDGDPQIHVHNQIARASRTTRDGRWRAVDTMSVRAQLGAVRAIVAAHVESELTRRFGVEWVPRADGLGNEIKGITQAEMDAYSTRTQAITAAMPEAIAGWTAKYGRAPNRRELLFIANEVTMATRAGKDPGAIDWDAALARWDARLGGALAGIAPRVTDPGAGAGARGGPAPRGPSPEAQARVMTMALARVQQRTSTWTRADLMREMAPLLPASAHELAPDEAVALLSGLTDRAIAGGAGTVVCLDAPEWPPLPGYLRRDLDGRSVYTRPGTSKYATSTQLKREEQLTTTAQRGGAPCLTAEACAQALGSTPAELDAALRVRAQEASQQLTCGLRLDQGAALQHALTSDRTSSLIVGPAGSGKTRTLAEGVRIWPGPVIGLAPSQAARNVLAKATGVPCYNTAQFLGHTPEKRNARAPMPLEPGTLVVLDEGGMVALDDIRQLTRMVAAADCKLLITGDHGQLTAVEGGGGMALLARGQEHTQLADPVRFSAEWERDASLRLRTGDTSVLTEYDQHARVRGGLGEEALEDARRAYVAAYTAGRDVLLMAQSNELCADLSQRIRDDLQHLGLVDRDGPEAQLRSGARASIGDLIITKQNDHRLGVANGDTWRVEEIHGPQLVMRKLIDCDRETGERRWAGKTVSYYDAEQSAELAYAVTGHSAQGRTVTEAHPLFTGSETREWAYMALTRATSGNYAHVMTPTPLCAHCGEVIEQDRGGRWVTEPGGTRCPATESGQHGRTPGPREADPAPGTRPAPELARAEMVDEERRGGRPLSGFAGRRQDDRAALGVLSDVLGLEGHELSASETLRRNLADADHLGLLGVVWDGETRDAIRGNYQRLLRERLPEEHRGAELSSTATWLWRSLRAAEAAGLDAGDVLARAINEKPLTGSRDVAAVIDSRVREATGSLVPQPAGPWAGRVPDITDPARREYVTALAEAMDERTERLGEHTAEASPIWARRALGPVPGEPLERLEWERRAAPIARYRERYGYADPVEAIGPEPSSDSPEQRAVWHAAFAQLGPIDGVDVRGEPDGRLLLMRRQHETETAWAPRWVGDELRHTRTGAVDAGQAADRAAAEERAAAERGDQEQAGLHGTHAQSARALHDAYRSLESQLAAAMDARAEWEQATTHTRHLAVAADTEYRRRHPEAELEPLRSAEPPRPTEEERAELEPQPNEPTYQTPGWVADLAAQADEVRERIADRQTERVPAEDHEWEDEGLAWPRMVAAERDAILHSPQPEIPASGRVMERIAGYEPGREPELEAEPG